MKWLFIYRRDLVVCYFNFFFGTFSLVLNMVFTLAVKTREMKRNICADGLKKNVSHNTSSVGKNCQYILGYGQLKLIFVGYGQLNSTTVLEFCTRHV